MHSGGDITFWTPPSLSGLQSVYLEFFPLTALPLVLIAAGVAAFARPRKRLLTPMTSGERVSWLFLTVPLAAYCLALLVTGFFHRRYIIVAVPGIVVAAACFLWRHYKESGVLSLALLLIFGGIGVFDELRVVRNLQQIQIYGEEQRNTRQMLALEDTLRGEGKRNFGMASGILFLQAYYHSNHPEQYGLIRFKPPWRIAKYVPLRFLSMEQIVANARETALIDLPPPLALALEKAGLHLKVRSIQPYVVYLE